MTTTSTNPPGNPPGPPASEPPQVPDTWLADALSERYLAYAL